MTINKRPFISLAKTHGWKRTGFKMDFGHETLKRIYVLRDMEHIRCLVSDRTAPAFETQLRSSTA